MLRPRKSLFVGAKDETLRVARGLAYASGMGKRILVVDAAEESFVGSSWRAGAAVFKASFHDVIMAESLDEVYEEFAGREPGDVSHVQVWGHGRSGQPLIAGRVFKAGHASLDSLKGASMWFRSCNVMQGENGHDFAATLADRGIDAVGHLSLIGNMGLQSYLVGLHAGDEPWWSKTLNPARSAPWAPHTVTALAMSLPTWTFKQDARLK
jgi:hypothetical protein